MFNLFNKSGLTNKQKKSIKTLSSNQEETLIWTNYYNTKNTLLKSCK